MAIIYPENRKEVSDRMGTDSQNELPEIVPLLRNSAYRSIIIAFAGRMFDIYTQQQLAQNELMPDSANIPDFQKRWGLLKGVNINAASPSIGFITATGTPGSVIPESTLYQISSDQEYEVINKDYTIQTILLGIITSGLTRSGSTATAEFSVDHHFASGTSVTFSGADQAEYNITAVITAIDDRKVSYQVTGTPATPATGSSIFGSSDISTIEVRSTAPGIIQNQDSGTALTLLNPLAGIDDVAYVQFSNLAGGSDEETSEEYRQRYLEVWRNPISNFNDADIENTLKEITGITKVWTFNATPQAGQCTTYFIRGNDAGSIFPSAAEVNQAKDELLKIKTTPMRDEDVIVNSPTPVPVDFVFTSLTPNSQAMQDAIDESLRQLFLDDTEVSQDLSENSYKAAITRTTNPLTGDFVGAFTLSSPVGDISVSDGELATFNSSNYNT